MPRVIFVPLAACHVSYLCCVEGRWSETFGFISMHRFIPQDVMQKATFVSSTVLLSCNVLLHAG